jgi:hypothetical protein
MPLDLEGWMSSKWGNGGFGIDGECAAPIYGGKIWRAVTEFNPPIFCLSARARAIPPSVAPQECVIVSFCEDEGDSLKTADLGVPPGPALGCFKNCAIQQCRGAQETKPAKNYTSRASEVEARLPKRPLMLLCADF